MRVRWQIRHSPIVVLQSPERQVRLLTAQFQRVVFTFHPPHLRPPDGNFDVVFTNCLGQRNIVWVIYCASAKRLCHCYVDSVKPLSPSFFLALAVSLSLFAGGGVFAAAALRGNPESLKDEGDLVFPQVFIVPETRAPSWKDVEDREQVTIASPKQAAEEIETFEQWNNLDALPPQVKPQTHTHTHMLRGCGNLNSGNF